MQNITLQDAGTCWDSDLTSYFVEAFKGGVFRDVWVKVDQRIAGHTVLSSQTVEVNDVCKTD